MTKTQQTAGASWFARLTAGARRVLAPSTQELETVCAWCLPRADTIAREFQRSRFASDDRKLVSHGMCPACVAKMERECQEYQELRSQL